MRESERFLISFDPIEGLEIPARVIAAYQVESCLAKKSEGFVLRLRKRGSGERSVLKARTAGAEDLEEEYEILTRLAPLLSGAVPEPVERFSENGMDYLIRSYLPGQTLAHYREREGDCTEQFCVRIGLELCTLLDTLHSQTPPVIHRDIKPENIILLDGGGIGLIDFGIARQYKSGKDTDTRRMGTRATAAPEQYGYAQTDRRTDLYALGMTLIWLVTGSYERDGLEQNTAIPLHLRRVLAKAVAFAPEDRYQTSAAFAAALGSRSPRRRTCFFAVAALVCVAVAVAAVWRPWAVHGGEIATDAPVSAPIVSSTGDQIPSPAPKPQKVVFMSDAMEAAVRQALGKPEGVVTEDELSRIERLAVVGMRVFGEDETFDYRIACYVGEQYQSDEPAGDMTDADMELFELMPNLRELYLCRQQITDISALGGLGLETLALCENRIIDLSPLAALDTLETLYLGGNPATDYSPLAGLIRLSTLVVEGSVTNGVAAVESLDFIEQLTLRSLSLGMTRPKDGDWQPLSGQVALESLRLWDPPQEALEAVNELDGLKSLSMGDFYYTDLTMLGGLTSLEVLGVHKGSLESLDGVERFSRLITLSIGYCGVTDLAPLEGLKRLNWVQFEQLEIEDFTPLATLESLGYLRVSDWQVGLVERDCPGHTFKIEEY